RSHSLTVPNPHTTRLSVLPPPFSSTSSGPHPDLHSFPTRRSSDQRAAQLVVAPTDRDEADELAPLEADAHADRPVAAVQAGARADRKSTRLNSSHVEISYAVFCLKKKKKQMGLLTSAMMHSSWVTR